MDTEQQRHLPLLKMLFPFVGIFAATALWSQWFAIPGRTEPGDSLSKRLCSSLQLAMDTMTLDSLVHDAISEYNFPGDYTLNPPKLWNFDSGIDTAFYPSQTDMLPPSPLMSSPKPSSNPSSKPSRTRFFRWARDMFSSHGKQYKSDTPHPLSPKHLPSMEWMTMLFCFCGLNPLFVLTFILVLLLLFGLCVYFWGAIYELCFERFVDAPEEPPVPNESALVEGPSMPKESPLPKQSAVPKQSAAPEGREKPARQCRPSKKKRESLKKKCEQQK